MEHSVNDSFPLRLDIILKNDLIKTLKLFKTSPITYINFSQNFTFLQYQAAICLLYLVYTSILV